MFGYVEIWLSGCEYLLVWGLGYGVSGMVGSSVWLLWKSHLLHVRLVLGSLYLQTRLLKFKQKWVTFIQWEQRELKILIYTTIELT